MQIFKLTATFAVFFICWNIFEIITHIKNMKKINEKEFFTTSDEREILVKKFEKKEEKL